MDEILTLLHSDREHRHPAFARLLAGYFEGLPRDERFPDRDIRPGGQDGHKHGPNLVPSPHRPALVRRTLTGPSGEGSG